MIFSVAHLTIYRYDRPVFLESQIVRLHPRCGVCQQVRHWSLDVEPTPVKLTAYEDIEGNHVAQAWFEGMTNCLRINAAGAVVTTRVQPFDFLLEQKAVRLPFTQAAADGARMAPFLGRRSPSSIVEQFSRVIAERTRHDTLDYLSALNSELYGTFDHIHRASGDPLTPEHALRERRGACRDLAVLFMDCCRCLRIPARFVSGYMQSPDEDVGELHAWPEVYLPGGGWRGYDPSQGLMVTDQHIVLCAGPDAEAAAPVSGAFRGTGATARMETHLRVEVVTEDHACSPEAPR